MSIFFKWSVKKMSVVHQHGKLNVVVAVEWVVEGKDVTNNLTSFISGVKNISLGNSFTEFEELTEQQVLSWCFEHETIAQPDGKNVIQPIIKYLKNDAEAQVICQINNQLSQKQLEPNLPWMKISV